MTRVYRIFGSELSPYSVKVRSAFRYKGIPHTWIVRNRDNMAEFQAYAKLPLIPLVITPDSEALQDSTPILERLEVLHPRPSIQPDPSHLAFLSALIEEYADEWVNKPMFHYRWTYPEDQRSVAERIARENLPVATKDTIAQATEAIIARMVPRLRFVGSSPDTKETIERSFERLIGILERHLRRRPYLFGGRPALADFGLAAQLHQCAGDPTPARLLAERAPRVVDWSQRMQDPRATGDLETWETLADTLSPLLEAELAGVFLPWTTANARALAAGEAQFSVSIEGQPFRQQTQKYHAKSLAVLKSRYAGWAERTALDPILEATGCRSWLAS